MDSTQQSKNPSVRQSMVRRSHRPEIVDLGWLWAKTEDTFGLVCARPAQRGRPTGSRIHLTSREARLERLDEDGPVALMAAERCSIPSSLRSRGSRRPQKT
jgi:hypothetical protein